MSNETLWTLDETAAKSNICRLTARKIAQEAGAIVKIGRSVRVIPNIYMEYIRQKGKEL